MGSEVTELRKLEVVRVKLELTQTTERLKLCANVKASESCHAVKLAGYCKTLSHCFTN